MITLRDIVSHLATLAPPEFVLQGLESRVEVGPQTDVEQAQTAVSRVLVTTYPSPRAVAQASQAKANLIITERPLFIWPVDRITGIDEIRLRLILKNYMSLYVMGSPWIAARDGLTDALVDVLEMKSLRKFETRGDLGTQVPIGRVCRTEDTINHSTLVNLVAGKLAVDNILFTGDLDQDVEDILVVAGTILDMPEIVRTKREGIRTIVTGTLPPEVRLLASEEGINVIETGDFYTEEPGMRRLYNYLSLQFPDTKFTFFQTQPVSRVIRPYSAGN